jgi:DNA-binding transcriptional ArsR family regulator
MVKEFTVRESARILGVAPSTISRHLPKGRLQRGRRARLTTQEVVNLAPDLGRDQVLVSRRIDLADEIGSKLPAEAIRWLEIANDQDLTSAVARHEARIPVGYWSRPAAPLAEFEYPELPTAGIEWPPLTAQMLDDIIPPADE